MRAFAKVFSSLGLLGVLLTGAIVYFDPSLVLITEVTVAQAESTGTGYLFSKIKEDVAPQLSGLYGRSIFDVPLDQIYEILHKDRRVKSARISRRFPNELHLEIEPHVPVANVLSTTGRSVYPLTREGTLFPAVNFDDANDAPVLRGAHFLKEVELRKNVLRLLQSLPTSGDFTAADVSEISFDKNKGFVLVLSRENSEVLIGHSDFAKRAEHIRRVVQYLRSENLKGRVIDARFSKKVVVRLRNAS